MVGELVLRRNDASRVLKEGKFTPNWEGESERALIFPMFLSFYWRKKEF